MIGAQCGGTPSEFHDGLIDDVHVYNRALSADEIKRLYKVGATAKLGQAAANDSLTKGLVGWWNFDGKTSSGTRVFDASGTGNYGILTNGSTLVNGKLGQGMEFDGEDDVVDAGSAGSLDDIFQNGGTISGWIKPRGWGELNLLKDDRLTRSER